MFMPTQQEVIKTFMKSLDNATNLGTTAVDDAVKACSQFGSLQNLIDKLISDCTDANSAEKFLKNYCGINLDNDDTGAITGSDAGGKTVKTSESIVPESGAASYPSSTTFTKRGLKFVVPDKSTLSADKQKIVQGLYSWWGDEVLNLLEESYGYSFNDKDATVKEIEVLFFDTYPYNYYAWVEPFDTDGDGKYDKLTLSFYMKYYTDIFDEMNGRGYDRTDRSKIIPYLDKLLGHELTHAIMSAKINYFHFLPTFLKEGMAELTIGTDDHRGSIVKSLAASPAALKAALSADSSGNSAYAAGYILLRYLAKQSADFNGTITLTEGDDTLDDATSAVMINALGGNDSIVSGGKFVTVSGGNDNDTLTGNGSNVSIGGGDGNDSISVTGNNSTLDGGADSDTINISGDKSIVDGGTDNDSIVSTGKGVTIRGGSGNDSIALNSKGDNVIDFGAGDGFDLVSGFTATDTLRIGGGIGTFSTVKSDSDIIVTVGDDELTISGADNLSKLNILGKDAAGSVGSKLINTAANVSVIGTDSSDTISNDGAFATVKALGGNDSINNSGSYALIDAGDGNDTVYSNNSSFLTIDGGAGNDTIYARNNNSKVDGGDGSDTISNISYYTAIVGGAGNDSIYNNSFYAH